MQDQIVKEHLFNNSINQVWDAISKGEEISSWFIKADFKPEVGYEYTFINEEQECPQIRGVVKSATPYTLSYTWVVEDTSHETLVTWKLEEVGGKTRLYLTHSGISGYSGDTAVAMFKSFSSGWEACVNDLLNYLQKEIYV